MGITFVEKSERRRPQAKIALVLAGGAISGGAFKLGAMIALNSFLVNRSVTHPDPVRLAWGEPPGAHADT